ncbi:DUF58 domain-containing protein [Candidatus Poribacteria bacterium]|nr:DUF58 domain-containing protein [Candidatus Poribacteria bacterium]MYG08554.1 DUF58 domain-containing protein [Candidatus Poribacteria bacterium]MYK21354.1 DUF58 domain-containing protein [Candidatus Poribacteria bacterium]
MNEKEILKKIQRIEIFTNRLVNTIFAGEYESVFKGQGITFDEVREYQVGDEIRTIDWNVTARMGQAYIKKYVEERELVMMLVVDMSASTSFGSIAETKAEIAAEIAALLAFSAIKNNDKVGLICFTDTVEHFVAPRKGKRHVLRVVRDILHFQPQQPGTNIETALAFVDKVLKPHSVVFLISDFKDTGYEKQLRLSSKRHSLIAIMLQDRRELELPDVGLIELEDAESGETMVVDTRSAEARQLYTALNQRADAERRQIFRASQVDSILIRTDEPYVKPLIGFFRQRAAKG